MAKSKDKEIQSSRTSSKTCVIVQIFCAFSFVMSIWTCVDIFQWSLLTHLYKFLSLLWVFQTLTAVSSLCLIRTNPHACSAWCAIGRGLLSLPIGALVHSFIAIIFGARTDLQYAAGTLHWSFLMSLFTVVPATTVFGSSWGEWQRIFAHNKLLEQIDYFLFMSAYGAVIGSWFGAWPMPLDWERPWQEWPICVTYGTLIGYMSGLVIAGVINIVGFRRVQRKVE